MSEQSFDGKATHIATAADLAAAEQHMRDELRRQGRPAGPLTVQRAVRRRYSYGPEAAAAFMDRLNRRIWGDAIVDGLAKKAEPGP